MNPPDRRWAGAPPNMSLGSASLLLSGQSWWLAVLLLSYSHNNKTLIVYLFKGFMSLITWIQLHLLRICESGVSQSKMETDPNFVQNIPFIINAKGQRCAKNNLFCPCFAYVFEGVARVETGSKNICIQFDIDWDVQSRSPRIQEYAEFPYAVSQFFYARIQYEIPASLCTWGPWSSD